MDIHTFTDAASPDSSFACPAWLSH